MPQSKKKADVTDYSACTFESLVHRPLPHGVTKMLERALRSFGPDGHVLATQWTEGLPTGQTEAQWFSYSTAAGKGKPTDICCADAVSWAISLTGATELRKNGAPWTSFWRYANGKQEVTQLHAAPFWEPQDSNADFLELIRKSKDPGAFIDASGAPVDDDFLPGDYFLYSQATVVRDRAPHVPSHINVYLGPFQEVVDGQHVGPVFHILNGSLGLKGSGAYVKPVSLSQLNWYSKNGWTIWQCRVKAIAQLYRQMVGLPFLAAADDKRPSGDRIAELWSAADGSRAPFPVGRSLSWHDGIHIHDQRPVSSFAGGRIVRVRLAETGPRGDTSFVLVQHRFDPSQRAIVLPQRSGEAEHAGHEDEIAIYSAALHVASASTYAEKVDGKAKLRAAAPPWLQRIAPRPVPAPRTFLPHDATPNILTWSEGGALVALPIAKGTLGSEVEDPEGHRIEKVTADGRPFYNVTHYLNAVGAAAWSTAPTVPTVPLKRRLVYWNALSGELLETPFEIKDPVRFAVAGEALEIAHVLENGDALARITAYEHPAVNVLHEDLAVVDEEHPAEPGELRFRADKTLTLHLVHHDQDGNELVEGTPTAKVQAGTCLARVHQAGGGRRLCKGKKAVDMALLELVACVRLTADERAGLDRTIAERARSAAGQALTRLREGKTCVLAAVVSDKSGWTVDQGVLKPSKARLAAVGDARLLDLHPNITGSGTKRAIAVSESVDISDADVPVVHHVEPTAALALRPLEIFQGAGKVTMALIEAYLGVETSTITDNARVIQEIEADNVTREKVLDRVLSGDVVDPVAEGAAADDLIVRGLEEIARPGRVLGGDPERRGIHYQIFAGKNPIDPAVKGSSGALEPVGKQRWWVLRDDAKAGLLTPDFATKLIGRLRGAAFAGATDLPAEAVATTVPKPSEWVDYCKEHATDHAAVIAAHPAEWTIDAKSLLGEDGARGAGITEEQRKEAEALAEEAAWLPADTTLEGLDGPVVYHLHPMRFITWLSTGLAVTVGGAPDPAKVAVRVVVPGHTDEKLVYDPDTRSFPFRTLAAEKVRTIPATVVLDGVATATKELKVALVRGEIRNAQAVVPSVKLSTTNDPTTMQYRFPVKVSSQDTHYLLADGHHRLATSAPSLASFRVDIAYNVHVPTRVALRFTGPGFTIVRAELTGAKDAAGALREGSLASVVFNLQPLAPPAPIFERARSASIHVQVAAGTVVGAKVDLVVEASGGDLQGTVTATSPLETRAIRMAEKKAKRSGEDVTKAQLLLSQIVWEDRLPCYRGTSDGEWTGTGAIAVTGAYDEGLARGLWRALYLYAQHVAHVPGKGPPLEAVVTVTDAKGGGDAPVTLKSLLAMPPIPMLESEEKTRRLRKPTEYPVIDATVIAILDDMFSVEHVAPTVLCTVGPRPLPAIAASGFAVKPTTDWSTPTGLTAILPLASEIVDVTLTCPELAALGPSIDLMLELPPGSAFAFHEPFLPMAMGSPRRAVTLGPKGGTVHLKWSGTFTAKPDDNLMTIRSKSGAACGWLQLTGVRDLTKPLGDACRDAAVAQLMLSQMPDGSGKTACLKTKDGTPPTIDGRWGQGSAAALAKYVETIATVKSPPAAMWAELEKKALTPTPAAGTPGGTR